MNTFDFNASADWLETQACETSSEITVFPTGWVRLRGLLAQGLFLYA